MKKYVASLVGFFLMQTMYSMDEGSLSEIKTLTVAHATIFDDSLNKFDKDKEKKQFFLVDNLRKESIKSLLSQTLPKKTNEYKKEYIAQFLLHLKDTKEYYSRLCTNNFIDTVFIGGRIPDRVGHFEAYFFNEIDTPETWQLKAKKKVQGEAEQPAETEYNKIVMMNEPTEIECVCMQQFTKGEVTRVNDFAHREAVKKRIESFGNEMKEIAGKILSQDNVENQINYFCKILRRLERYDNINRHKGFKGSLSWSHNVILPIKEIASLTEEEFYLFLRLANGNVDCNPTMTIGEKECAIITSFSDDVRKALGSIKIKLSHKLTFLADSLLLVHAVAPDVAWHCTHSKLSMAFAAFVSAALSFVTGEIVLPYCDSRNDSYKQLVKKYIEPDKIHEPSSSKQGTSFFVGSVLQGLLSFIGNNFLFDLSVKSKIIGTVAHFLRVFVYLFTHFSVDSRYDNRYFVSDLIVPSPDVPKK